MQHLKVDRKIPQTLTHLSPRSHPRHLVGNRTTHKDTIINITSDSQMNRNFPPDSLTFNNYFYEKKHKYRHPTSQITKEAKQKSRLWAASNDKTNMRTRRNSNTEFKEINQLNHDRPDLRQPGRVFSHQPPIES